MNFASCVVATGLQFNRFRELISSKRCLPAGSRVCELDGYSAGLDVTFFKWYKQLMEIYPDAKVLLTVRDPERWFASMTFLQTPFHTLTQHPYAGIMTAMGLGHFTKFIREVLVPPNASGILGRVNRAMLAGKEEADEVFNSHVAGPRHILPQSQ